MKHMQWLSTLSLIWVLAFSGLVMGEEKPKRMHQGCGTGCLHMKEMLQLTEEQQKKIDALKTALDKELLPLKTDLKLKKAELEKFLIAENPSKTAIEKKVEEIGTLKTQIHKALVNHRLKVREILTLEQRIQFDQVPHFGCRMEREMRIIRKGMHPLPSHSMEELEPGEPLEE